jgi:hypothetical protein
MSQRAFLFLVDSERALHRVFFVDQPVVREKRYQLSLSSGSAPFPTDFSRKLSMCAWFDLCKSLM